MTTRGVFDDAQMGAALSNNMGAGLQPYALASGIAKIALSITPSAVAANTSVEQQVALPGAQVGDAVLVNPPALVAGVALVDARISATNVLQLQFTNSTSGSLTPPAGAHQIVLFR